MDPLSIIGLTIGGASLLTSLGFGIANATKETPTLPGPTGAERLSAASSRQLANKLQTGQGLSDTAYNARLSGARDVAAGQAAEAAGVVRSNPFMPGVIANRIVKEAFLGSSKYLAKTQQELTLTDTEQSLANLRASVQAEGVAGQMAANVSQKEQRAAEYKLQMQMAKDQALANSLLGVAKGTASLLSVAGQLMDPNKAANDKAAEANQRFDELKKEYQPTPTASGESLAEQERRIQAGKSQSDDFNGYF